MNKLSTSFNRILTLSKQRFVHKNACYNCLVDIFDIFFTAEFSFIFVCLHIIYFHFSKRVRISAQKICTLHLLTPRFVNAS